MSTSNLTRLPPPTQSPSAQQAWTWMETVAGLETLVLTYGAPRVIAFLEQDAADPDTADILQRFGRERVVRVVRNLAAIHGQEV